MKFSMKKISFLVVGYLNPCRNTENTFTFLVINISLPEITHSAEAVEYIDCIYAVM